MTLRILFAFVGGRGHFDPLVPIAGDDPEAARSERESGRCRMADKAGPNG